MKVFSHGYLIPCAVLWLIVVYVMCRFRQVYVCVSLYIYSIEQPGPMGDTGCAAWGLADPLPLSLSFSSSSFFLRGRGVGGVGGMVGICCKHVTLSRSCPA